MEKMAITTIKFPDYSGVRCLMMPYIQADPDSVPAEYQSYREIVESVFVKRGDIGFLTIDESPVPKGKPHRGARSKTDRALHTEVGIRPGKIYAWGATGGWGNSHCITLDSGTRILIANNLDNSCAIWDAVHRDTSVDGDIGHVSYLYPYETATMMKAGDVHEIGILTPHESLPVPRDFNRQFIRIVSSGVHGREPYFTENPLVPLPATTA